ncbi:hypothetical protein ES703_14352 [subsurface metagenome]
MPTKKEYSEAFNAIFGLEIDWTKLKVEDLVQLAMLFGNQELLLKKLGIGTEANEKQQRIVLAGMESLREFVEHWDGPLARLVRKVTALEPESETP